MSIKNIKLQINHLTILTITSLGPQFPFLFDCPEITFMEFFLAETPVKYYCLA